jgi:hypothetical protein
MAAIIYWVPILFLIALAAFSRAQSRVRVEYSIARAFTGCAAVVAAGRTRADGGGARQADRGRRESCLSGAGYRLRAEPGTSRGAARAPRGGSRSN